MTTSRWRVKGNRNSRRTRRGEGEGGGGGSEGAGEGKRRDGKETEETREEEMGVPETDSLPPDMTEALRSSASSASHRVADGGSEDGAGVWNGGEPQEGDRKIQDGFDVKRFRNGKYSGEFKDGKMHGLGRSVNVFLLRQRSMRMGRKEGVGLGDNEDDSYSDACDNGDGDGDGDKEMRLFSDLSSTMETYTTGAGSLMSCKEGQHSTD